MDSIIFIINQRFMDDFDQIFFFFSVINDNNDLKHLFSCFFLLEIIG